MYQIFEQKFTESEFKRFTMIDEYKDVFCEHYKALKMLEIKDNEEVVD